MTTAPDQIYTTYINTTPEKLWNAITTPEFCRQYWGGNANISEWKKGAAWSHESADKTKYFVGGEVLEINPPKHLVLSWVDPDDKKEVSRVSFDIEVVHDLVKLVIVHGQFKAGSTMPEKVGGGWPLVISSLKSFLETGKPIDIVAVKGQCGKAA